MLETRVVYNSHGVFIQLTAAHPFFHFDFIDKRIVKWIEYHTYKIHCQKRCI